MKINTLLWKVIVWRIVSVIGMLVTLWVITGDLVESTSVTVVVQIVQTFIHAIFESAWKRMEE